MAKLTSRLAQAAALVCVLSACGASGGHARLSAAKHLKATTTTSTTTTTTVPPTTTAAPTTTRPPATAPATTAPACAPTLASSLASTGGARQLMTVEASGYDTTYATFEYWQLGGTCWVAAGGPWTARIGENGFSDHHVEGDGTSPTGIYSIGSTMYGNAANPGVHYAYQPLSCGDWWDEDPTSAEYNTFQVVPCGTTPPFGGGSEALWTETAVYPSFALIDYNTDPIVPGAGSAIFLHAQDGNATTGCVSLPLSDLDTVLDWLEPGDSPRIVMAPSSEIADF